MEYVNNLNEAEAKLFAIEDSLSPQYMADKERIKALSYSFESEIFEFWNTMRWITWVSFMVLFFALNHVPELIYTSMTKRQFQAYYFKNVWDFVIFILFFTFIIISYKSNLAGTWKERQTVTVPVIRADIYARNFAAGTVWFEEYLLIFCVMSLWIRAFYMLRYNEYFGRLTGIVARLIPDVVVFFLFYLIEIFFSAMVA